MNCIMRKKNTFAGRGKVCCTGKNKGTYILYVVTAGAAD